ncbi:MAG: DNA primase [Candidatus Magasanikbacteria bacterium]
MSDDVQAIKDKIDVVDLISEYVQLKPAGINHKGLCPFHHEKSPSFMANRERQSWHCFGCNKGGDIFTFVEEMEGMEFREALKYLADKAGIQLTNQFKSEVESSQKNRIKEINTEAARFFYNFLLKMPVSQGARDYLNRRALIQETIDEWQIGFISDQWDLLTQYLLKKGFGIDDLVASGLTIKRDGADMHSGRGFYDRFRGRVMFPIWDIHDTVIGFTGRVLVETEHSGGKYVNTPQTPVFDKSNLVFGLNKAKKEIKAKDLIVMVEGQMDVIACHQAGMSQVVATSGTALTEKQIHLLKRYSMNLNMAFDADAAGQAAAKRGIDLAVQSGMNVKVIQIPAGAGKDPDECIKKNKQTWFDAVQNAQEIMQWYFTRAFAGKNINDSKHKQQIATALLTEIKNIPFAVERDHWMQELGNKLHVDVEVLREDMSRLKREVKETRSQSRSERDPATAGKSEVQNSNVIVKKTRLDLLIERLIALILKYPAIPASSVWIPVSNLSTSSYLALYERIKNEYTNSNSIDLETLRREYAQDGAENIIDILQLQGEKEFSDISTDDAKKEYEGLVLSVKDEWLKEERKRLQNEINDAERSGNAEMLNELMKQFSSLKME